MIIKLEILKINILRNKIGNIGSKYLEIKLEILELNI